MEQVRDFFERHWPGIIVGFVIGAVLVSALGHFRPPA